MEPFRVSANIYSTPEAWAPITTVRSVIPRGSRLRVSLDWGRDSYRAYPLHFASRFRVERRRPRPKTEGNSPIGVARVSSLAYSPLRGPEKTYLSPRTSAPATKIRIVATREAQLRAHLNWQGTSYQDWEREIGRSTQNLTLKPRPSPLRFVA